MGEREGSMHVPLMFAFIAGTAKLEIKHTLVMPATAGIRIPAFAGMTRVN
jgi:hypothetical protein